MDKQNCIFPDCLVTTDFGSACEHSCSFYNTYPKLSMETHKMAVKLTLTLVFPEWWGADEFWNSGKEAAIREMILEDQSAFVEDAIDCGTWKFEVMP